MAAEAVIAHFEGAVPSELVDRYREAVARFAADAGAPVPLAAYLLAGEREMVAVLVWDQDPGHEAFGRYMQATIGELNLPFPRVEHLAVVDASWELMASRGASARR